MRFLLRKKRQPPAVIIVALIDVLIVVLIFLMVTTSFKKPLAALKLALPESSQATKAGANENPPLVVVIEQTGGLRIGQEATPVTYEMLKTQLMDAAAKNPELKLSLDADKNAPFGQIVKVMDAAKAAKIKYVSAFSKEAPAQ
jgi:biopolymer transport protein ExbD